MDELIIDPEGNAFVNQKILECFHVATSKDNSKDTQSDSKILALEAKGYIDTFTISASCTVIDMDEYEWVGATNSTIVAATSDYASYPFSIDSQIIRHTAKVIKVGYSQITVTSPECGMVIFTMPRSLKLFIQAYDSNLLLEKQDMRLVVHIKRNGVNAEATLDVLSIYSTTRVNRQDDSCEATEGFFLSSRLHAVKAA